MNETGPESVVTVTVPLIVPVPPGTKVIGIDSVSPEFIACGSAGAVTANGEVAEIAVTFSDLVAVTVSVALPVVLTGMFPKDTGEPVSAELAGRPKARILPSRVPT